MTEKLGKNLLQEYGPRRSWISKHGGAVFLAGYLLVVLVAYWMFNKVNREIYPHNLAHLYLRRQTWYLISAFCLFGLVQKIPWHRLAARSWLWALGGVATAGIIRASLPKTFDYYGLVRVGPMLWDGDIGWITAAFFIMAGLAWVGDGSLRPVGKAVQASWLFLCFAAVFLVLQPNLTAFFGLALAYALTLIFSRRRMSGFALLGIALGLLLICTWSSPYRHHSVDLMEAGGRLDALDHRVFVDGGLAALLYRERWGPIAPWIIFPSLFVLLVMGIVAAFKATDRLLGTAVCFFAVLTGISAFAGFVSAFSRIRFESILPFFSYGMPSLFLAGVLGGLIYRVLRIKAGKANLGVKEITS